MEEEITYVNSEGKRLDGRKVDDLREIKILPAVISRAQGSCYMEWGQNKALVGVYGPREALPQHIQDPTKALVDFVYRMATFSVPDRKRPAPGRREKEISKVSGEALARSIFLERFPNTTIDIYAYIFDSNAGTRVSALAAASVALADAGIPMRGLVAPCAVGRAGGNILLDLNKEEEDAPDAVDMPLAIIPRTGEVVLLQMDGLIPKDQWMEAFRLGVKGCNKVYEMQKEALKKRYIEIEKESGKDIKKAAKAIEKAAKGKAKEDKEAPEPDTGMPAPAESIQPEPSPAMEPKPEPAAVLREGDIK